MNDPALSHSSCLSSSEGKPVALLGVSLAGQVFGAHARIVLRQRYKNEEARAIEAIYTFPIPSDAALVGFAMEAVGRRLEAEVKEREEAFRVYDEAIASGHGAALLDQERRNVFTASVGNLLPDEETIIEVAYVQELGADEGALRLMIPTLVAPRYIPGQPAGYRSGHGAADPTDRVPDADRISPEIGAVNYGLTLEVVFDLGRDVTVESPSHEVVVSAESGHRQRVSFRRSTVALDRDLVLVASGASGVAAGVVASRKAGEEGTFALTVVPDLFDSKRAAAAHDVVFVVDVSGSMDGDSIVQARTAMRLCLRHLAEGDRFQIIAFSTTFHSFQPSFVPFTQKTLEAADRWVAALRADGGTEMLEPLLAAVDASGEKEPRSRVVVLLTDGQVGNEAEILERVVAKAGHARIYTFGIGTNVSDLLLRDLARRTKAAAEFIHPGERIDAKVTAQFARALATRVDDVSLTFEGIEPGERAPAVLPPLVDGEPWVVYCRYREPGVGRAQIRGTLRGERFFLEVPIELPAEAERDGLAALWATARIRDLEEADGVLGGRRGEANKKRIVALSVEHKVASRFASFVVVERRTGDRLVHGQPEARPIPVHAPAGWAIAQPPPPTTRAYAMASAPMSPMAMPMAGGMPPGAIPRARMASPAPPAYAPAPQAPPAPRSTGAFAGVLKRAKQLFDRGAPDALHADTDDLADTFAPSAEPFEGALESPFAASPAEVGADPIAALFERQLASGLWEGDDRTDKSRLLATTRALKDCADAKIDSTHPVFGAQVKKAIEALCALAIELGDRGDADAGDLVLAVTAALAVASGKRLRDQATAAHRQIGLARRLAPPSA